MHADDQAMPVEFLQSLDASALLPDMVLASFTQLMKISQAS